MKKVLIAITFSLFIIYFFRCSLFNEKYDPELYKVIVYKDKDDMGLEIKCLESQMDSVGFYMLVRDLIVNKEFDLKAHRIGVGYAVKNKYCDLIPIIEERVLEIEKKAKTHEKWVIGLKGSTYSKSFQFLNDDEWYSYKDYYLDRYYKKFKSSCSK